MNTPELLKRSTLYVAAVLCVLALSACHPNSQLPGEGTWRVINYWAIWCAPCREEIPILNALNARDEVTVLGVNFDNKSGDDLADHRRQLGIRFESAPIDPVEFFGHPKPQVLPTTLLVDPQGVLRETLIGPQTEASLMAAIGRH